MPWTRWSLGPRWRLWGPHDAQPFSPEIAWTPLGAELEPLCFHGGLPGGNGGLLHVEELAACFQSSAPFLEGSPTLGHLAGGRRLVPPQDQPRALTTPAVSTLQGFTHCSNQGIHGRRDRRLCPLPSSQHRDSALCMVALSKPEDRKTACS